MILRRCHNLFLVHTIYLYSTTHSVNGLPYLYFCGKCSTRTGTESFHTEPLYILRCFPSASCDHTESVSEPKAGSVTQHSPVQPFAHCNPADGVKELQVAHSLQQLCRGASLNSIPLGLNYMKTLSFFPSSQDPPDLTNFAQILGTVTLPLFLNTNVWDRLWKSATAIYRKVTGWLRLQKQLQKP